ncbi:unnamed protein product [Phytophthora lilii]|uniref:Unnamed protein product n=1 Tax=Phytophthora lilii TaxID=2077276 RepID=A0A9W6XHV3_9STRA|nr:unnamed protein product [Phytophthora lilii]
MLPVKVGDVLEFDPRSASKDGEGGTSSPTKSLARSLITGRVVEVLSEEEGGDGRCTVQVSPESLQPLDLKRTFYKLRSLSPTMVGLEIELESVDTKRLECGIVKKVDCDINCALVVFAGGRKKEWLDLTFFRVRLPGHHYSPDIDSDCANGNDGVKSSPTNKSKQNEAWETPKQYSNAEGTVDRSQLPPEDVSVTTSQLSMPRVDPDQFDWHLEGTHVELCNHKGQFLEGAALCSKTNSHLQLYNERRGYFEIACSVQGFKVVINGLENLKTFPMGQIIDVYSPLVGEFRSGIVLKAAVVGRMTPVRFMTDKAVKWLDLKSQTFKLVFLPHITDAFEHFGDPSDCATRGLKSFGDHSSHRSHSHDSHRNQDLEYPRLYEGDGIEIFNDHLKQYVKYKVASLSNWSKEAYIFEPVESASGGVSSRSARHVVSTLSQLRTRLILQPSRCEEYHRILVGHRVDVYDRDGKNVMNGKIHAFGGAENSSNEPTILVRFKDGHQMWIDLRTSKVTLRMHPAPDVTQAVHDGPTTPVTTSPRMENSSPVHPPANGEVARHTEPSPCATIPAVHQSKSDPAQSKSDQALFRIPSGEVLEDLANTLPESTSAIKQGGKTEVPATGGSPGRRPSPGKRVPALHRRASQSADVPKTHSLPDLVQPSDGSATSSPSPSKEEPPVVPAITPTKALSLVQSPRLGDSISPVSPGGPLPPVQPSSNPNSPTKTQLPIGPVQAAREPNLGLLTKYLSPRSSDSATMAMMLQGKRALVVGLMNKHSLAAGVTQALLSHGASVVASSKTPLSESHIRSCAFQAPETGGASPALHFEPCDVESDASIAQLMQRCGDVFDGELDILVHSVAFAPRDAFTNGLLDTPRAAWTQAMDISAYSLVALAKAATPLMDKGEENRDRSVLALTYAGSTKAARVRTWTGWYPRELLESWPDEHCVCARNPRDFGKAKYLGSLRCWLDTRLMNVTWIWQKMRKYAEDYAPLGRNSSTGDVGSVAAFLSSDLAASVTGQTIYGAFLATIRKNRGVVRLKCYCSGSSTKSAIVHRHITLRKWKYSSAYLLQITWTAAASNSVFMSGTFALTRSMLPESDEMHLGREAVLQQLCACVSLDVFCWLHLLPEELRDKPVSSESLGLVEKV